MSRSGVYLAAAVWWFLLAGAGFADITTGLVAHYEFEGNANDSSGSSYDATASASGVSYGTPSITYGTMSGKMLKQDGSSGYIDLPAAALNH